MGAFIGLLLLLSAASAFAQGPWYFRATIGVDDGVLGRPGAAIFRVFVGEEKVYESPVMKPGDNPITLHVPLKREDVLTLEVADTGDGHGGDWGNWCDARIQDDSGQTTIWLSDLKEQVLQEWITTRKDRNIVGQPMKLRGRVYVRGLGTISGSRMRYADWYAQWQQRERQLALEELAAQRRLQWLRIDGNLHGAQLLLNGKMVERLPVSVSPNDNIQVRLTSVNNKPLFSHPVWQGVRAHTAQGSVPLSQWVPDSIRWSLSDASVDLPILDGTIYAGISAAQGEVQVTYLHPFSNTARALGSRPPAARYTLNLWCAVRKSPSAARATSYVAVYEGEHLRARTPLLAANRVVHLSAVALDSSAPLRVVIEVAGDGNLGDEVYVGGTVAERNGSYALRVTNLPYLLDRAGHDAVQVYHFPTSDMRASTKELPSARAAFRVQAPAELIFDNYGATLASIARAERLVREAETLLKAGKTAEAAERLAIAWRLDDENPHIYRLRAQMAKIAGRADIELKAWKRLVEISRADLPLRRQAKQRIAELYRQLDGNRPEIEFRLPPPAPPNADIASLTQGIVRLPLRPPKPEDDVQMGELHFTVPRERDGWWLQGRVDSRGLAVSVQLQRQRGNGWQTVWSTPDGDPQEFPLIEYQTAAGRYRLLVQHDSTRDSVEGAFHLALSLRHLPQKPDAPSQQWTYRLRTDGSAEVAVVASGVVALPMPLTAEELVVEGAKYSLLPPVYEYLSRLELRHAQVLLLHPTADRATVRFRWLDAAYNVPMTRYGGERKDHFYFRSLAGLGKATGEIDVTVQLPEGTADIQQVMPEPQSRDASTLNFRVPSDRVVIVTAKHSQLDTRWLTASYRRMTVYIPDTPLYRRWLPEYLALLMGIYDRERQVVGGYEPEDALFVSLTAPAQLSGYGGATWGGPQSETWIACTGRVGPYNLRYEAGGDGVEAHELKWVFLSGVGENLPYWLLMGAIIWIEEQGKVAGDTAYPDIWYRRSLRPGAQQFRKRYSGQTNPIWLPEKEFRERSAEERMLGEAMMHEILHTIAQRYGVRVWAELFRQNRTGKLNLKDLPENEKHRRVVDALVQITGDQQIREMFRSLGLK
jgi:tetratricopeptide (TPR) repeat protein